MHSNHPRMCTRPWVSKFQQEGVAPTLMGGGVSLQGCLLHPKQRSDTFALITERGRVVNPHEPQNSVGELGFDKSLSLIKHPQGSTILAHLCSPE